MKTREELEHDYNLLMACYSALLDHCNDMHESLHIECVGGYHRIMHPKFMREKLNS